MRVMEPGCDRFYICSLSGFNGTLVRLTPMALKPWMGAVCTLPYDRVEHAAAGRVGVAHERPG